MLEQQRHLASPVGPGFLLCSFSCDPLLHSPHRLSPHRQPWSLPQNWPLKPDSQHQPCPSISSCGIQGMWCFFGSGRQRHWCFMWLSLCFALFSPAAVFFSVALRSLHLGWSPHQLSGLLECRILSSFTAPFQECWLLPDSFFFFFPLFSLFSFCSTQLRGWFLAFFGGLRSSASMQQMYYVNTSICRWMFLMCLWEKGHAMSYSSVILFLLFFFFFFLKNENEI